LLYLFTKRAIKLTAVIIEAYHCYQLHTELYLTFSRCTGYYPVSLSDRMVSSWTGPQFPMAGSRTGRSIHYVYK
jgi:hypothetical protein